ncbi:Putative 115 kDa protein in type-1 retrotransposable element R1DM [Eumeta japonica]|uniref:115 kDa protein in type-1 retrotransposable element R1DM n=1 Tax=Eumeta variegata TaxID=151549 RepID=A0A4C1W6G1_EUMVA|nr:Putative 115 kDa protein in type-1 retrotransposable element R1DM [Eumeta japonica]
MDAALNEGTLTTEMVKSVGSCDQLDEVVETYTECIRQACDAAIPRKSSNTRGLKPLVESRVRGLKRDARTKKRRIRNAAPADGSTWSGYVQARRFTKGQWLRRRPRAGNGFALHRMERACGTASTGSSGKREKPGGCPIKTDSGQVIEGEPTGVVNHPKLRGSARVDPPLPGLRLGLLLKHSTLERPGIDGFTSDICQAAIFRDLGLFLAMANKCLELGYFPRAWKVAAIKVIPKPGKEDYARPKSYRPRSAPVLGKTVERMLVGASSGT